jgi:glycosyltransferase involved in cell wall biosynthesis
LTSINLDIAQRIPLAPPKVAQVPAGIVRPIWSVMIPVYNCSKFLPETLRSVLQEADDTFQVEVVDDYSTDANVENLVKTIGEGRIQYFRQSRNVGSLLNFYTCITRSKGHFVHLLHGDDRVRPGFYKKFESLFKTHPELGAAYCRFAYIGAQGEFLVNHELEGDTEGMLDDKFIFRLAERQRIQYAAMVVKREVYEDLGSFYGVEYGEDWEMWMRIASKYPIGYIPGVYADYRKHLGSVSGRSFLTGKNIRDLKWVMDQIQQHLPTEKRKEISKFSKRFYGAYALRTAGEIWKSLKNSNGVKAQIREAWKLRKDAFMLVGILKLYTRMVLNV